MTCSYRERAHGEKPCELSVGPSSSTAVRTALRGDSTPAGRGTETAEGSPESAGARPGLQTEEES